MSFAAARDFARAFARKWADDQVGTHGAALAYYALFSIAPLLVVTIAVAGLVLGDRVATSAVLDQLEAAVGPEPARLVRAMIAQVASPRAGSIAAVLGVATMLLGATGVLVRLQDALRRIWGVAGRRRLRGTVRQRLIGLGLLLGFGAVVSVSMALTATLGALHERLATHVPMLALLAGPTNRVATLALSTLVFALLFRTLPGTATPWRDLWAGGFVTAVLFAAGIDALGWYLARASTSVYGAAGSLVLLMLWIYYSAEMLLAGAVFTVLWTRRRATGLPARAPAG